MTTAKPADRRALTDLANAELFINVMQGELGVYLPAVSELDLRIFLYDLLPRKMMGSRAAANGVRASLKRFFDYLSAEEDLRYSWAKAILRDKRSFEDRWDTFPGGSYLDYPVAEWMNELTEDLMVRAFVPSRALAGADEWSQEMGIEEVTLYDELQRLWLTWRDEEIRFGHDSPPALVTRLLKRQAEWTTAPHSRLKNRSPSEAISAERRRSRHRS